MTIASALSQGFSYEQILDYLMKQSPKHAKKISKALGLGFSPSQILSQLTQGNKTEREGLTEFEQTRNIHEKNKQRNEKLVGATALGLAGAAVAPSLLRHIGPQIGPEILGVGKESTQPSIPQQSPLDQEITTNPPDQIPKNETSIQPEIEPQKDLITKKKEDEGRKNLSNILESRGLKAHVDQLSQANKDPNSITGILYLEFPQEMKEMQKQAGLPMEQVIAKYIEDQKIQTQETTAQERSQEINQLESQTPEQEDISEPQEKISHVITPNGLGVIKQVSGNNVLVEEDGKIKQVKADQIFESPISQENLAKLFQDVIKGIEQYTGQEISRHVEWAGYDSKRNELAYIPHGSKKLYMFDNISKEDVDLLTKILTLRKSTNENYVGAWKAGTKSPIGAAMSKLIQKLQTERGGKGNEYTGKYEKIYDAFEPAKTALQNVHKNMKMEEKAKKRAKKEKNAKSKRKKKT